MKVFLAYTSRSCFSRNVNKGGNLYLKLQSARVQFMDVHENPLRADYTNDTTTKFTEKRSCEYSSNDEQLIGCEEKRPKETRK